VRRHRHLTICGNIYASNRQSGGGYKEAWSRFVAGDWTPDMLHYVYPDRNRAIEGLAYLRKMQIISSDE
jgi:hypothetical protein